MINNQFAFYVRDDGMIFNRGEELPSSARMLTILAAYHGYMYSGEDDAAFMLLHFPKAKALAEMLSYMYKRSLALNFSRTDPRFGIPIGGSEAGTYFKPVSSARNCWNNTRRATFTLPQVSAQPLSPHHNLESDIPL